MNIKIRIAEAMRTFSSYIEMLVNSQIVKPVQITSLHILSRGLFEEICFRVIETIHVSFDPSHRIIGELWIDFAQVQACAAFYWHGI